MLPMTVYMFSKPFRLSYIKCCYIIGNNSLQTSTTVPIMFYLKFYVVIATVFMPIYTLPKLKDIRSIIKDKRGHQSTGDELEIPSGNSVINIDQFFGYIIINIGNEGVPEKPDKPGTGRELICPEHIFWRTCAGNNESCRSDMDCYTNEVCCITINSKYPCCVQGDEAHTTGLS